MSRVAWRYSEEIRRDNISVVDRIDGWKFFGGRLAFGSSEFERFVGVALSRDYYLKMAVRHS